jgi:hypothetical protein
MFGYCPCCDNVLADIGPGEVVCLDCYLAEVRAEPQEERLLAMIEALGDKPARNKHQKSPQKKLFHVDNQQTSEIRLSILTKKL